MADVTKRVVLVTVDVIPSSTVFTEALNAVVPVFVVVVVVVVVVVDEVVVDGGPSSIGPLKAPQRGK